MSYRAAIIGFGGMGQRHYQAYKKNDVEVAAICDWDRERILSYLPDFPPDRIFDDYRKLIGAADVDIISVASNGPTHAEVATAAAEAGILNIFCEKPIATNLNDAQRLIETCRRRGVRLAVNHIRRWNTNYRRLKELIATGAIGKVRSLYFNCGSTGLGNFTSHFFDTARFLSDSEYAWVVGFLDDTGTENPRGARFIDPAGYGVAEFQDGTRFLVDTSEATGVQYLFQITGEYGRIIIDELNNSWSIRARQPGDRELPYTRYGTPMPPVPFESDGDFDIVDLTARGQAELLAGGAISCTGMDGLRALEMVIAWHVSAEAQNQRTALPLKGEALDKDVPIG